MAFMCKVIFVHVYRHTICLPDALSGQNMARDNLELEL